WSPPQNLPGNRPGFPVEAVAFRPDGAMLAGGSDDGSVKLWDLRSRRPDQTHADLSVDLTERGVQPRTPPDLTRPILSIAFSPDGKRLAAASRDGAIKLWDVDNGELVATFAVPAGTTSVTFPLDGDGRTLATSDQNGTPVVWALDPDQVRKRFCGGPQP